MSLLAQLVIAIAIAVAGFAAGIKWHAGIDAQHALEADQARQADARQQQRFNDQAAGEHAEALATLETQLGDARAQIARLFGRPCLSGGTIRMLNATGRIGMRAPAGDPAGAPAAAASGADDGRVATDQDVAGYIALCRTRYAEVADQLNKILDVEDRRHPVGASP